MQVKEVCAVIEEDLGLCKGWLTATPCQVGPADCPATASTFLPLGHTLLSTCFWPESCAFMIESKHLLSVHPLTVEACTKDSWYSCISKGAG